MWSLKHTNDVPIDKIFSWSYYKVVCNILQELLAVVLRKCWPGETVIGGIMLALDKANLFKLVLNLMRLIHLSLHRFSEGWVVSDITIYIKAKS